MITDVIEDGVCNGGCGKRINGCDLLYGVENGFTKLSLHASKTSAPAFGTTMDLVKGAYTQASTARFGTLDVVLARRNAAGPCEEILVVSADSMDLDVGKYAAFHKSFVKHRVEKRWPHKFSFVYDLREQITPGGVDAGLIARITSFLAIHATSKEHYGEYLHATALVVRDRAADAVLKQVIAIMGGTQRPLVTFCESDECDAPAADQIALTPLLRKLSSVS